MKRIPNLPELRPARCLLLMLLAMFSTAALAQDEAVGNVAALTGQADVIREDGQTLALAVDDPVFRGDTLQTREESQLDLLMTDGSRFTLDQNTRLVLAEYLPEQESEGLFNLIRGRLRSFVSTTFSRRSDSFKVDTKEGVMGVQGTIFDVYALAAETQVYVFEGVVSATPHDPGFSQTLLITAGQFTRIVPGAEVQQPVPFHFDRGRGQRRQGPRSRSGLRSGASQDLRSGGRQGRDPTRTAPRGPEVFVPPFPNPPDGGPPGSGQPGPNPPGGGSGG